MYHVQRAALVAALQARGIDAKVAEKITISDEPEPEGAARNLTPEKATALLAMFSEQIQRYSRPAFNMFRSAARLITAQRPFYERYNYKPHNGAQEMARRRKQITKGQLTVSNGLVGVDDTGQQVRHNSHGQVECPISFHA